MNGNEQPQPATGIRRALYIALAFLFLGLGMLGAVLPGLPTTPFLLLTSYFLIRSSPWLHDRVMGMPVVGAFIRDWRENRGIRLRVKLIAYGMVLAVVGLSVLSQTINVPIKVGIVLLATAGVGVVWRLPTVK